MTKKKLILGILAGSIGLFVVVIVVVAMSLDFVVKSGVEAVGPKMTGTAFTLEGVEIRPFSGVGNVEGLLIGNPDGYASSFAIKMNRARIQIRPTTMWSEKVIVETVLVEAPEITFEGGRRENNLGTILKNINSYVGDRDRHGSEPKLQVNHFKLTGAKIHLRLAIFGDRNITLAAPEIELRDLGAGPEGVTSAELAQLVIERISSEVGAMMTSALAELGRRQSAPSDE